MRHLLTQSATIERAAAGAADDFGVPATTYTTSDPVRCRLEHATSDEEDLDRSTQRDQYRLYVLPGVTVTGQDRVVVDDVTYELDGDPIVRRTPSGVHHLEIPLRRTVNR